MKKKGKKTDTGQIHIREVRLDHPDPGSMRGGISYQDETGRSSRNTEMAIITYLFCAFFLLMAGYLVWFQVARREQLNESVYNSKMDSATDRIIRGPIVTENGTSLAYSTVDYTGNETRVYPYYNIFAHVIGYATNGRSGLEASESNALMSCHSSLLDQLRNSDDAEKLMGDTVVVTLDPLLQEACWNALGSYDGAIVVMEPDTGKILAMVSKPDYDPNAIPWIWDDLVSDESSSVLLNRSMQGLYPPGSIFKILTALAYMRQYPGSFDQFSFDCDGIYERGDASIHCYEYSRHGHEDLQTAFAYSCNTAFASIGMELDIGKFRSLADTFLFNSALPVSLPHSPSVFALQTGSSDMERMTTAIGQGNTLVTPLHMAMITSTVANGGIMMKPYLVSRIVSSDGTLVQENKPEIYDELMSSQEASYLSSYMKAVVSYGTAVSLSWSGFNAAGKTGSAEYDTPYGTGTHSWFVGYCGADDPQIAVAVIAEDGGAGSSTATPIAQQIFEAYYYR